MSLHYNLNYLLLLHLCIPTLQFVWPPFVASLYPYIIFSVTSSWYTSLFLHYILCYIILLHLCIPTLKFMFLLLLRLYIPTLQFVLHPLVTPLHLYISVCFACSCYFSVYLLYSLCYHLLLHLCIPIWQFFFYLILLHLCVLLLQFVLPPLVKTLYPYITVSVTSSGYTSVSQYYSLCYLLFFNLCRPLLQYLLPPLVKTRCIPIL